MPSAVHARRVIHFGVFEVDIEAGELRKRGVRVKLQEQPLKILRVLLERAGQVVSKEELRVRVWPENTFVEFDQGLYSAIARLRDALGDSSGSPRFIETVACRGYRFIAPVPESLKSEALETPAVVPLPTATPARRYVLGAFTVLVGCALLLAILLDVDVGGTGSWLRSRGTPPIRSLAVLPLENLSGDPGQEYFADGMTDELITDLAQLADLRVISRTSAMRYKKTPKSLREIARELNVDAVVEGTVARLGNRVRIRVQLVRTADDRHLWAQAYDRDFQDIFRLQNDAAHEIADQIGVSVMSSRKERLSGRAFSMKPVAYEAYLRGRFYSRTGTPEDAQKAKANFRQTIQEDPQAAVAYAALAGVYVFEAYYGNYLGISRKEAAESAKSLARKALELNPELVETQLAMKGIAEIDWDWAEAEKHSRRALVLEPGSSDAHLAYGMFLAAQGRFKQAIPETQIALERDPVSAETHASGAFTYYLAGEFDRAIEQDKKALQIDPGFEDAHANLLYTYIQKHLYDEAVQEFGKCAAMWRYSPESQSEIEKAYRRGGIRAFWNKQIELSAIGRIPALDSFDLASLYTLLGENDKALEYLDRAWEERDPKMGFIKVLPELASLHSETKFQNLVQRMGFPEQ